MDYIEDFGKFNMKNKLDAESYVNANISRLTQMFNIEDDFTPEEKEKMLIEYFTRFPDQIKSISLKTFGAGTGNYIPTTNNIGGVIKYR